MSISGNDIQKLKMFIVGNADPSEVDRFGRENPVDLLIRAVYGKVECEELEGRKTKFNKDFIPFYTYKVGG